MQFDFVDVAVRQLDEIVEETGAASRAEVVRRALGLFKRALDAQNDGGSVLLKDKHGDVERIRIF